VILCWQS